MFELGKVKINYPISTYLLFLNILIKLVLKSNISVILKNLIYGNMLSPPNISKTNT